MLKNNSKSHHMCSIEVIILILVMPLHIILILMLESLVLTDSQVLLSFKARYDVPLVPPVILVDLVPPLPARALSLFLSFVLSFWT